VVEHCADVEEAGASRLSVLGATVTGACSISKDTQRPRNSGSSMSVGVGVKSRVRSGWPIMRTLRMMPSLARYVR